MFCVNSDPLFCQLFAYYYYYLNWVGEWRPAIKSIHFFPNKSNRVFVRHKTRACCVQYMCIYILRAFRTVAGSSNRAREFTRIDQWFQSQHTPNRIITNERTNEQKSYHKTLSLCMIYLFSSVSYADQRTWFLAVAFAEFLAEFVLFFILVFVF